jgi:recombination protein RecA
VAATKAIARHLVPRKSVEEIRANVEKKYGPGVLIKGSELKKRVISRVSTGALSYDIMLGGGYPLNHWNEVIGNPSSGKTSSIYKVLAEQMSIDPKFHALWVASEPFMWEWAEIAGVDVDRIEVAETAIMEEAFEIVIDYLDNRLVDCIVIDSFPALSPMGEEEAGFDQWQMGLGARLNAKFFRKSSSAQKRSLVDADDRDCLLLVVNQWREKIGLVFGDSRTTPGGKAKDYFLVTRTEYTRDGWIVPDKTTKKRIGIAMRAHTIKNKTAPVERAATVDFYFEEGGPVGPGDYDDALDVYDCGIWTSVLEKDGGTHIFGDVTWRKRDDVIATLREDIGLRNLMKYEVLRASGINATPPKKVPAPRKPRALQAPDTPTKSWGNGK